MAKQVFTALQILTAAELNTLQANDYNWTVSTKTDDYTLVAADKGTRIVANKATAIAFTVDDSIFAAGDTLAVSNINTGVLTLTAGAGVTINGADVLTVAQWQGGTLYFTSASSAIWFPTAKTISAGGLVYLTGAAFTAAATVSLPNSTFTSTYRNYRVILTITSGSTDISVTGRLRASGSDDTTANYNTGYVGNGNGNATATLADLNQTSAKLGLGISNGGVNDAHLIMDLINPQVADKTLWSAQSSHQISNVGAFTWFAGGGLINTATQFDSFTFIASAGNITGTYRVYGYADS